MANNQKLQKAKHPLRRAKAVEQGLTLYMSARCPYCVKVNRVLDKLNIRIRIVNPDSKQSLRNKLTKHGGRYQVPCLHIDNTKGTPVWMYESHSIIRYLNQRFSRKKSK